MQEIIDAAERNLSPLFERILRDNLQTILSVSVPLMISAPHAANSANILESAAKHSWHTVVYTGAVR